MTAVVLTMLLCFLYLPNLFAWNNNVQTTHFKLADFKKRLISCTIATFHFSATCYASVYNDDFFKVEYPDNFEISPKLVKTHDRELFIKSVDTKGYNFGVTVSIVSILNFICH